MGSAAFPTRVPPYRPGSGGSGGSGGGGSAVPTAPLAPAGGPVIRYPPDVFPIPSAQEFNAFGQANTAAIQANVELVLTPLLVLPVGMVARIANIVLYVANLGAGSVLSFTITINGAPIQGYSNVPIFPGATARLGVGFTTYVDVPANGTVQAFFTNGDGGAYTVGVAISGWQWSQQDGDRWLTQGT